MDGAWGSWNAYESCSTTCGSDGTKTRTRSCDSPPPNHGGAECQGGDSQTEPCNRVKCPDPGGLLCTTEAIEAHFLLKKTPPGVEKCQLMVLKTSPGVENCQLMVMKMPPGVEKCQLMVLKTPPGVENCQLMVMKTPPGVENCQLMVLN